MSRSDQFSDIRVIADAISDGSATQDDYKKLETLLKGSDDAMTFYCDYMSLDGQMKAQEKPDLEVVMRRMQVDELIIRPKGEVQPLNSSHPTSPLTTGLINSADSLKPHKGVSIFILALICGVIGFIYSTLHHQDHMAELLNGRVKSEAYGIVTSGKLRNSNYEVIDDATLKVYSGFKSTLSQNSKFHFNQSSEFFFEKGQLLIEPHSSGTFKIETPCFFLEGHSDPIQLNISEHNNPTIKTGHESLMISPKRWRPKHYWNFDRASDRSADLIGKADGINHPSVQHVKGLIGAGAYQFSNNPSQIINVGSGGGTALATGSFAVHDGVSIEAMIHSNWNGKDYDEIFRKDKDGELRMILSFQNDWVKDTKYTVPQVEEGPVLSFGLYLVGEGYHELELPFNGHGQQLTLEELHSKAYHIVATYDCSSGLKAIYIDGKMLASHQYKPGTRVLSGGPGSASIGNSPVNSKETFDGIIDEVAFYDFALNSLSIQNHFEATQKGLNYFGQKPSDQNLKSIEYKVQLPPRYTIEIETMTGLPIKLSH